ncbi:MAG: PHB depolymerase family esterase, partial [Bacteroidota bacterium]
NQILIAGGIHFDNTPSERVDIYDLSTGAWTMSNLSVSRGFINNAVTVCGKAFFAGGGIFDLPTLAWTSASDRVDIYDPTTGEWTTAQLSHSVINHSVVAIGNQVLIAGGGDPAPPYSDFSTVDIYSCPGTLLDAQFTHGDSLRTYKLYVPAAYDGSEAYPLVIALHGSGQTNDFLINFSRMNEVADAEHFLVAYPQALWVYDVTAVPPFPPTDVAWNTGGGATSVNDDVGFMSRMIYKIGLSHRVDPARVYACGLSSGGQMSYRLACELSDRIAAFASVSGMMPADVPCSNGGRPVPLMEIHGTADPIVPFDGIPPYNLSIPDGIAFWVSHNGCDATPTVTQLPDLVTTDNSTVTVKSYGNCDAGTEVLLYEIVGGGHPWPGSTVPFVPPFLGQRNEDINGSAEIWNFFKNHTHPDPVRTQFPWHPAPVVNTFGLDNLLPSSVIRLKDFDNDGTMEAFVMTGENRYYENTGSDAVPQFVLAATNPFGIPPFTGIVNGFVFDLVDIDGDCDPDIFQASFNDSNTGNPLRFLENTGTPDAPWFGD